MARCPDLNRLAGVIGKRFSEGAAFPSETILSARIIVP